MARAGHASVTVDRLGYGASDKPLDGKRDLHRLAGRRRAPDRGPAESRVPTRRRASRRGSSSGSALAGHSAAGQISITEAYTYRDLKALVIVGFSYSNLPRGNDEFGFQRIACDKGGDPIVTVPRASTSTTLSSAVRTPASAARCSTARPRRSQDAAVKLHYRDPCGDNYSLIDTIQKQAANAGKVTVPVLGRLRPQRRAICGVRLRGPGGPLQEGERAAPEEHRSRSAARTRRKDVPEAARPLPRPVRALASAALI